MRYSASFILTDSCRLSLILLEEIISSWVIAINTRLAFALEEQADWEDTMIPCFARIPINIAEVIPFPVYEKLMM
ncbi:hypothetical protein D3C81_1970560 [compost metagenome]